MRQAGGARKFEVFRVNVELRSKVDFQLESFKNKEKRAD